MVHTTANVKDAKLAAVRAKTRTLFA